MVKTFQVPLQICATGFDTCSRCSIPTDIALLRLAWFSIIWSSNSRKISNNSNQHRYMVEWYGNLPRQLLDSEFRLNASSDAVFLEDLIHSRKASTPIWHPWSTRSCISFRDCAGFISFSEDPALNWPLLLILRTYPYWCILLGDMSATNRILSSWPVLN